MNRLYKLVWVFLLAVVGVRDAMATGWEEEYGGVMLQGFYWDSFEDTRWTNLTSQVDELSAYYDLIWVPNSASSGYSSMGYNPQYWFQHESSFGTSGELRTMIKKFKEKGTGFIADVVINHRNGVNGWCDFPVETDHHGNTWELGLWSICCNDEMAYANGQPKPTGAYDEGENFDGCRDLDHTNTYVQDAVKAYLDYLLNELGYAGFRYDMVKGFAAYYVGLYNDEVKPTYSVGEYYDGNYDLVAKWIDGTIRENKIQSAAFDFPLKFRMNQAFGYPSNFSLLATYYNGSNRPEGLLKEPGFRRFSVTFIDNHDTFQNGGTKFSEYYTVAGNAFILCHPGTPCIFLPHWKQYKNEIKQLINVRKAVGIHNQSNVEVWVAQEDKYVAKVYGKNGDLFIKVGYGDYTPDGFNNNDIVASGEGYCVWSKVHVSDLGNDIVPDNDGNGISVYVKKNTLPASWDELYCYGWIDANTRLTASFPGEEVSKVVTIAGDDYYKYSFDSSASVVNFLFADGNGLQTIDMDGITEDVFYSFASADASGKYTLTEMEIVGDESGDPITIALATSSVPDVWNGVKLYAWGKDGAALLDPWPGTEMSATMTIGSSNYYIYTFPSNVTLLNLLFTDGNNKSIDIKGVNKSSYYAIAEKLDGVYTVSEVPVAEGDGISVYLEKNSVTSTWKNVNFYAWDSSNTPLLGSWPGKTITETVEYDGREYYVYSFDKDVSMCNIIFNNGVGQTADIEGINTTTYFSMKKDFSYYRGTKSITIYLDVLSADAWSKVNYYAWDDDKNALLGAWPGMSISDVEIADNNKSYYYYRFAPYHSSLNIIFNDGTNQTVDIENIRKSTFYTLNSITGNSITVSTESTDIPSDIERTHIDVTTCWVYPNPCTDCLYINTLQRVDNVQIYDLRGQILVHDNEMCVDVSHLTSGIYIYRIALNDGTICRGKFIKQ